MNKNKDTWYLFLNTTMSMSCCGGAPTEERETAKHEHDPKGEGKQGDGDCCGGGGGGKHSTWMSVVVWILVGALVIFFVRTVIRGERSVGASAPRAVPTGAIQNNAVPSSIVPSATAGNVTVTIPSISRSASGTTATIVLDTHSVNLDAFDAVAQVRLRGRDGADIAGTISGRSGSGHHQSVTMVFAGVSDATAVIVRDLDGVPETVIPLNE